MKRHKVTTACEACRSKKKKCDGQRPRCQACRNNNTQCNWSNYSGRSSNVSKQYIHDLESKVRELEQNQIHYAHSDPSPRGSIVSTGPGYSHTFHGQDMTNNSSRTPTVRQQQPSPFEETASKGGDWHNVKGGDRDSMQQPVSSSIDAHLSQSKNFFGTASIGSFISQVVQSIDDENSSDGGNQPFSQTDTVRSMTTVRRVTNPLSFDNALPPRKTADSFLATYWTYIHTMFPFLDRAEIESSYRELWSGEGNGTEEPVFLFILNMMFALSARLSPTIAPEQRATAAKTFLVRAQETLSFDIWGAGTFQSIQALLLLGQYYHTTDPHQSWLAVSMAVHTAQGLGMHLPETSEQFKSIRARELMRRVWHGCVMMDRVVSQTYGRPPMVSKLMASAVPPPLSIDDNDLDLDLNTNMHTNIYARQSKPNAMEFFVRSLQLYELVADILTNFYSHHPKGTKRNEYEYYLADPAEKSILFYENQLHKWFDALPEYLKLSTKSDNDILARQAIILRQRFLHVRILLLRPTLRFVVATAAAAATATSNSGRTMEAESKKLHHQLMLQCATTCVETAQEAITLVHDNSPPDPAAVGVVSAWGYNILFLYTAATVLVAARLCPAITCGVQLTRSWDSAMGMLKTYEPFGLPAKRALAVLSQLDSQIQNKYAKREREKEKERAGAEAELTPSSNAVPAPTSMLRDDSHDLVDSSRMSDVQLDFFDPATFDLEDFSWMDSAMPFNV